MNKRIKKKLREFPPKRDENLRAALSFGPRNNNYVAAFGVARQAAQFHDIPKFTQVKKILARIQGEFDGPGYHWLLKMKKGGGFAYVTGECSYTGWEASCSVEAWQAATVVEVLSFVPQHERLMFDSLLGAPTGYL